MLLLPSPPAPPAAAVPTVEEEEGELTRRRRAMSAPCMPPASLNPSPNQSNGPNSLSSADVHASMPNSMVPPLLREEEGGEEGEDVGTPRSILSMAVVFSATTCQ